MMRDHKLLVDEEMSLERALYGVTPAGETVERFTLRNRSGMTLKVITYGGIITELHVPDRSGATRDVVLGCKDLSAYLAGHPWFGAITGRVAGRISGGSFQLEGSTYQLEVNHPPNHLHGGSEALDKRVWIAEPLLNERDEPTLILRYVSPHGECGYPGRVELEVGYTLTHHNAVVITYKATTDQATPLSLTNHTYFNLSGGQSVEVSDHLLQISCPYFVPTDEDLSLSGRVESVEGRACDLRTPQRVGEVVPSLWQQHGDHYLKAWGAAEQSAGQSAGHQELRASWIARLTEPLGGVQLDVYTTASGVQLYSGVSLDHPADLTKSGEPYTSLAGLCLECQGYPDGVNQPEIEDIIISPSRPYYQQTTYAFSVTGAVDE